MKIENVPQRLGYGNGASLGRAPRAGLRRRDLQENAGFRAARRTGDGPRRGWVAVYRARDAGLDTGDGNPWATSCETHHVFVSATSEQAARASMRDPGAWCEACREAEEPSAGGTRDDGNLEHFTV